MNKPQVKTTKYRRKCGTQRRIVLYRAWKNLLSRVRGNVHGKNYWEGVENHSAGWHHFRDWSLANGFSRENCSLDRVDPSGHYHPDNCRWVTKAENCRHAIKKGGSA